MRVITVLENTWIWKDWAYGVNRYWGYATLAAWIVLLVVLSLGATAYEASGAELQKPGTLCAEGLSYDVVKVEGRWRAICYEGNVDEARAEVSADPAYPSSKRTDGGCMTCDLTEELKLEALWALRQFNRR